MEPRGGHLGHLFESQMESERQIKELANIEKLEVAEIMLQEAIAQNKQRSSTPGGWMMWRKGRLKILLQIEAVRTR